jgi:hypothetical protein
MRKTLMIAAVSAALAVGGTTAAVAASHTGTPSTPTRTLSATAVDEATARSIATGAVPGGTVTEIQLLTLQGRATWKVHVDTATARHEVLIDATDGLILSTDQSGGGSTPTSTAGPATSAGDDQVEDGLDDGPGHDLGDDHGGGHGGGH